MPQKESYRHQLQHYQQPGQAYFITWNLQDAVPKKALKSYKQQLEWLKLKIDSSGVAGVADSDPRLINAADRNLPHPQNAADRNLPHPQNAADRNLPHPEDADRNPHHPGLKKLKNQYYLLRKKYIKAYDDLLDAGRNPKINLATKENTEIIKGALLFWEGKKIKNHAFCIMPNHVHWVVEMLEKDDEGKPVYLEEIMYSVKRFSAGKINKLENREGKLWQKESFDTTIRNEKHLYYAIEYTLNNPLAAGLVRKREDWSGSWCEGL